MTEQYDSRDDAGQYPVMYLFTAYKPLKILAIYSYMDTLMDTVLVDLSPNQSDAIQMVRCNPQYPLVVNRPLALHF